MIRCCALLFLLFLFHLSKNTSGYQISQHRNTDCYDTTATHPIRSVSRRNWLSATFTAVATDSFLLPDPSLAAPAAAVDGDDIVAPIRAATKTLETLLDNWEKAVVDCNYADVPRELLDVKNKEELLEKASTFALFDKSVAVVTCKTSNKNIRDYLGRTGIGPVVGLDKMLRKALDIIDDPDDLDTFVQATESIQQALSRADSYSYTAGGDYSALNNFERKDQAKILDSNTNLKQVQQSIQLAVENLNLVLGILDKS